VNCFDNYIGLRGCSEGIPASGLYINSLPGLPSELFSKIANSDQATYQGLWSDVQITSQSQLLIDVQKEFSLRYKLRTIIRQINLGKSVDTASTTALSAKLRGFTVNADTGMEAGYTHSNIMGMSVDYLELHLLAVPIDPFNVKIIDADTDEVLFSLAINNVAYPVAIGWNTIPVNEVFASKNISFVYESTQINSVELALSDSLTQTLCDCLCDWYSCDFESCPGTISGIESADLTGVSTVTSGLNAFGLTAKISFTCSYEPFVCANKKVFARALWFLEGHHTLFHAIYSPSFSRYNTVDRKITEALMNEYLERYNEELKMVIRGINLQDSDICLECDGQISTKWVKP